MSAPALVTAAASAIPASVASTMPIIAGTPWLVVVLVSAVGLVIRAALPELRWWLALRGTTPGDRPAIIRALGTAPARESSGNRCQGSSWVPQI